MVDLLRLFLPLFLSVVTVGIVDRWSLKRKIQAPGFLPGAEGAGVYRRWVFLGVLTLGMFLTVFQSLAVFGVEVEVDFSAVHPAQLFWVHGLLLGLLLTWYLLGFAGQPAMSGRLGTEWQRQLGLACSSITKEILLGLGVGLVGWAAVLAAASMVGALVVAAGGESLLPSEVPPSIVWMASLSLPLRFLVAVSAGVVEELFFRGFLQPRLGIILSSLLFVVAHLSYGQPFLLVGVSMLSVGFALLARWRGNIWAAMAAHFTFDAVQLLILIPAALQVSAGTS